MEVDLTRMFRRALISLQFVLAGAMLAGCSDVIRTEFATRAAAAEIIQKGWVPSVIPESAAEIREWHDLDTNTGHGTFRFSQDDAASFQAALVEHATRNPATSVSHEKYRRFAYTSIATTTLFSRSTGPIVWENFGWNIRRTLRPTSN